MQSAIKSILYTHNFEPWKDICKEKCSCVLEYTAADTCYRQSFASSIQRVSFGMQRYVTCVQNCIGDHLNSYDGLISIGINSLALATFVIAGYGTYNTAKGLMDKNRSVTKIAVNSTIAAVAGVATVALLCI
jgi:hypothetical protein